MKARYINPYTDFGFKKLFGEEGSKDLLIDFLNQLLPRKDKIADLNFQNIERYGDIQVERRAVFDIHCCDEKGNRFIVEMQKAKLKFFKDRAIFYSTFPIKEQAEKGDWNFRLMPIYCVAILDFTFDDDREKTHYINNVQLKDQYCQVFSNKLTYIFIEMPHFNKEENDLEDRFDKWLYFLKHMEDFDAIPDILNEEIFIRGFRAAEIANFDRNELMEYEESLKIYRDLKGVIDTSYEEGEVSGLEKGIQQGRDSQKIETARQMKQDGLSYEMISKYTGLSPDDIDNL